MGLIFMMQKISFIRVSLDPKNPSKGKTDWGRVDSLTEEEVFENAFSDRDNPPISEEALSKFRPAIDVKAIRRHLHYSQSEFAKTFRLSKRTIQEWEQHRSEPDLPARILLTVIAKNPDGVKKALQDVVL